VKKSCDFSKRTSRTRLPPPGESECPTYKGKTPKAYFLTRKGWEILSRESDIPPELIGSHKEIHVESRWSPQMYHRLHTVDLMISALESFDGQLHGSEFILYRA
jgi:hypothetical protein